MRCASVKRDVAVYAFAWGWVVGVGLMSTYMFAWLWWWTCRGIIVASCMGGDAHVSSVVGVHGIASHASVMHGGAVHNTVDVWVLK